jgi:hypothetical protein
MVGRTTTTTTKTKQKEAVFKNSTKKSAEKHTRGSKGKATNIQNKERQKNSRFGRNHEDFQRL